MNPVQLAGPAAAPEHPLQPAVNGMDADGFLPVLEFVLDAPQGQARSADEAVLGADHDAGPDALPSPPGADAVVEEVESWLSLQAGQRELRVDARDAGPGRETPVRGETPATVQLIMPDPRLNAAPQADVQQAEPVSSGPWVGGEDIVPRQADRMVPAPEPLAVPRAERPGHGPGTPSAPPSVLAAMVASVDGGEARGVSAAPEAAVAAASQWNVAVAGASGGTEAARSIEARFGEQMLHSLREQVELQVRQSTQHAILRLDPPDLGALDIHITHDQGKLSVSIHATQADVARLLTLLSERLRHELLGQHFAEVTVEVGSDDAPGGGRRQPPGEAQEAGVLAAAELVDEPASEGRDRNSDVLARV